MDDVKMEDIRLDFSNISSEKSFCKLLGVDNKLHLDITTENNRKKLIKKYLGEWQECEDNNQFIVVSIAKNVGMLVDYYEMAQKEFIENLFKREHTYYIRVYYDVDGKEIGKVRMDRQQKNIDELMFGTFGTKKHIDWLKAHFSNQKPDTPDEYLYGSNQISKKENK